jgi:hypothetical protein
VSSACCGPTRSRLGIQPYWTHNLDQAATAAVRSADGALAARPVCSKHPKAPPTSTLRPVPGSRADNVSGPCYPKEGSWNILSRPRVKATKEGKRAEAVLRELLQSL